MSGLLPKALWRKQVKYKWALHMGKIASTFRPIGDTFSILWLNEKRFFHRNSSLPDLIISKHDVSHMNVYMSGK